MADRVVLDTNLCILLCVGLTKRQLIEQHKRLTAYDVEDFDLLSRYLQPAHSIVFLPNVTSETSNFLRYASEPYKGQYATTLAALIEEADERFVPSSMATKRSEYGELGITDAALLETIGDGDELLTDDLGLYLAALGAGFAVVNFNHIREARPDMR